MDWYLTVLRFLHVTFTIVVIGSVAYNVLFLGPALSRLDPSVQRPSMLAIGPRVAVGILASAAVVLATSGSDKLFDTDWGRAVTGGFLLSAVMFSIGVTFFIRNIFRMRDMALAGTPPSPEQAVRMQKQIRYGGMVALTIGLIAIFAMVMARGYHP